MSGRDCRPLDNAPQTNQIRKYRDNRLGAVYSALYSFWSARHVATTARLAVGALHDAYSVILFNHASTRVITNDLTSSPDELLGVLLATSMGGGTNFSLALREGQAVMERYWSAERHAIWIRISVMYSLILRFTVTQGTGHDLPF
jgi:hypothetical protein